METVLDALRRSLNEAAEHNKSELSAPSVILWTDKDCQWESIIGTLRQFLPQLLTLGQYDPQKRIGPAVWLKCAIARTVPEANWPTELTPIIYLPNVSRQELRAVEECPKQLQPLAELQYRGVYWTQVSAKDWTVLAFLQSKDGGLGLEVGRDSQTQKAMMRSLPKLLAMSLNELAGKHLDESLFDSLLKPDAIRDLLSWLNDPTVTRTQWSISEWNAFCSICHKDYGFDTETDGQLYAVELLGTLKGNWSKVWKRFAEAPQLYPKIPAVLRKAKPSELDNLFDRTETWPQDNDAEEAELQHSLLSLREQSRDIAAKAIVELEARHGRRRGWVWAALNQAPLATALQHLTELAEATSVALGGTVANAMAEQYVQTGWKADAAVLDALASLKRASQTDVEAVCGVINSLYRTWLENAANHLQQIAEKGHPTPQRRVTGKDGRCILFADGLRFDVGQKLKVAMGKAGFTVSESWDWAPLPSVTPTAKPRVSPIAELITSSQSDEEFRPSVKESGQALTVDVFRNLLTQRGFQVLSEGEVGNPTGKAWTECGELDTRGHSEQWKLAWRIEEQIQTLIHRITTLFEAGWQEIQVVTDHGWLLLPGGLPKMSVPGYLVETRWGRCARLKQKAVVDLPSVSWYWNPDIQIAIARGIQAFKAGLEYAHGSLTLQECVVPMFTVRAPSLGIQAQIKTVKWRRLRCDVAIDPPLPDLRVDIRKKTADPASSAIVEVKPVIDGKASVIVEDETLEGYSAFVVLLDSQGNVVSKQVTTIGE